MLRNFKSGSFALLAFLGMAVLFSMCKQGSSDNSEKLLAQALKNKDYATAAFAYNNILLKDSNNIEVKDSLARIYIRSGNYEGGLRLGEQVMAKKPENKKLLELVGIANEQMKFTDKSVANFNVLYKLTGDYVYLYKISAIYFDNNMFTKADSTIDLVLTGADTARKININLPDGTSQLVPIKAAAYNMKGAIAAEGLNDIKSGVKYFQDALKIAPEFSYPQLYLQRIAQYMQQGR
jgi:tetratricopeptide (TPR) repeat protein